ncbi:SapB/AmfS family lanthipeptide [Streptomyces sp. NPDC021100]
MVLLDLQVMEAEWDTGARGPGGEPETASILGPPDSGLSLLLC